MYLCFGKHNVPRRFYIGFITGYDAAMIETWQRTNDQPPYHYVCRSIPTLAIDNDDPFRVDSARWIRSDIVVIKSVPDAVPFTRLVRIEANDGQDWRLAHFTTNGRPGLVRPLLDRCGNPNFNCPGHLVKIAEVDFTKYSPVKRLFLKEDANSDDEGDDNPPKKLKRDQATPPPNQEQEVIDLTASQ